ncbi:MULTISPECIES: hypothetical protein [Bacillus]|uniref:hypothetical protein n=1 Tax=Bacillus TaxID=1386 RepID=UPI00209CF54C|nr:hypothetical protein [Bacillus sp. 1663tsa1]MCP1180532.1 hypothetical protein [Bacillus sp. 1663tsa1]
MASKEVEVKQTASAVRYPVAEVIEQSDTLFGVPSYTAAAALQGTDEIDLETAEKKVKALLQKEVK